MKKAETKEHSIQNIKIFLDDLLTHSTDDVFRKSFAEATCAIIEGNKLSQMKAALAELERMYLEDSLIEYKRIMSKVFKEGFVYDTTLENIDKVVEDVLAANSIKTVSQYKAILLYVELHYYDNHFKQRIDDLNGLLANYEKRRGAGRGRT